MNTHNESRNRVVLHCKLDNVLLTILAKLCVTETAFVRRKPSLHKKCNYVMVLYNDEETEMLRTSHGQYWIDRPTKRIKRIT